MGNKETAEEKNEKFIEELISKKSTKNVNVIHDKSLSIGDRIADNSRGCG